MPHHLSTGISSVYLQNLKDVRVDKEGVQKSVLIADNDSKLVTGI